MPRQATQMIKSIESFIEAVRADSTSTARRAQWFLRDALAHGPKRVSDVEEAAEKAHIDAHALTQARGDTDAITELKKLMPLE